MKKGIKLFLSLLCLVVMPLGFVTSCGDNSSSVNQLVDYVDQLKFDTTSGRKASEVDVYSYIDGDTVHFCENDKSSNYPTGAAVIGGVVKARFLAIDTPESTGKVQPWGKKASNFTHKTLQDASAVMIESEDSNWNLDSTAGRYLLWIWYKKTATSDWRLLNLELMQEGLAAAKNYASTIYADIFGKAYSQAVSNKLNYYSTDKDPDFDYSTETELITIKDLRDEASTYVDKRVKFIGLVTKIVESSTTTAYVQYYDDEADAYYGMPVFLAYTYASMSSLYKVGNEVMVNGTYTYSDNFGYQVSGISYNPMYPNSPTNSKLVSENNDVTPFVVNSATFTEKASSLLSLLVEVKNITVEKVYTTDNGGASDGAMTLTCSDTASTNKLKIRTSVLYKDATKTIPVIDSDLLDKTITIKGVVDSYNDSMQIQLFAYSDISFVD